MEREDIIPFWKFWTVYVDECYKLPINNIYMADLYYVWIFNLSTYLRYLWVIMFLQPDPAIIFASNIRRVSRLQVTIISHKNSTKCPLHIKKICLPSRIKVKHLNVKASPVDFFKSACSLFKFYSKESFWTI